MIVNYDIGQWVAENLPGLIFALIMGGLTVGALVSAIKAIYTPKGE